MRQNTFKTVLLLCTFYLIQNTIIAQSSPKNEVHPRITLERTELRILHSDIVEQDYELQISLPFNYSKDSTKYPVIFLLDPSVQFLMMRSYTDDRAFNQAIPKVIIVGIGYGGEGFNKIQNFSVGRSRDYTPIKDTKVEESSNKYWEGMGVKDINVITGGAPLFMEFIRKELFPFIESNYRIDTRDRMLYGYSAGGLFGLYTLFHDPNLFNKYLIGSPWIGYKDGIITEHESNYAKTHGDLKAEVFMSSGELENWTVENMKKMENLLNSRNYKNLKLNTRIFENESHSTSFYPFMNRGFIEFYKNDKINNY